MDEAWHHACLALRLLALDPGLGGINLRARAGPVRDRLTARIPAGAARLHPAISDAALFGAVDLSATLAAGALRFDKGLLATPGPMVLGMAERTPASLAARLAQRLDAGADHYLIALDEGAGPDEALPAKLAERLAFHVDLNACRISEAGDPGLPPPVPSLPDTPHYAVDPATVTLPVGAAEDVTTLAATLGIDSLRAPRFALRAAQAHACLYGRGLATKEDLAIACALTLAHRATQAPEMAEETPPPQPTPESAPPDSPQEGSDAARAMDLPETLLLEAVCALLPDGLLDRLAQQTSRAASRTAGGNGSGVLRKGNRRGRPLPARPGRPSSSDRIDLIASLRAAAPWQTIRQRTSGRPGLHIRADDLRIKRHEQKSDRLVIFAVDASGSAALARLAEAKGAVELLLTEAYARRDHVALIAFRGTKAELLLPPTRSLVQTKRRLAALPGGGGTPLAAGLQEGLAQALQARRRGMTPTLAILTDGRANIALDGQADRKKAAQDAQQIAQLLRSDRIEAIIIDTGNRPEPALRHLSQTLDGTYVALPRADAARLSQSLSAAMES